MGTYHEQMTFYITSAYTSLVLQLTTLKTDINQLQTYSAPNHKGSLSVIEEAKDASLVYFIIIS